MLFSGIAQADVILINNGGDACTRPPVSCPSGYVITGVVNQTISGGCFGSSDLGMDYGNTFNSTTNPTTLYPNATYGKNVTIACAKVCQ